MKNRPPYHRNRSAKSTPDRKPGRGKIGKPKKIQQRWLIALALTLIYSAAQFASTGKVSWPADLLESVTGNVTEYADRPNAGWRQATDKIEEMGARKEGSPITDFDLTGKVVRIADGDTVSILDSNGKQHKIRFFGIDTPERDQPHGLKAKKALEQLVSGKRVGVVVVEKDDYGRTVGTLFYDGKNINARMVADGHAWWYRYYAPHERILEINERDAREQKLGLWSEGKPVAPWDWRRGRR